jgi:hypothetical protein
MNSRRGESLGITCSSGLSAEFLVYGLCGRESVKIPMLMIAQDQNWDLHEKGVPHPSAPSWMTTLAFKLEHLKESKDILAHLLSFCDSVAAMSALEALWIMRPEGPATRPSEK